jgi:signal peptidase II
MQNIPAFANVALTLFKKWVAKRMKKRYALCVLLAGIVIALDQITKMIITRTIPLYGNMPIVKGFFNLVSIHNRGMAFGLMNQPGNEIGFNILTFLTIGAIIGLLIWYVKLNDPSWSVTIAFGLILGGAIGNLIDRLYLKKVIDFLDFYIGSHHWPAFNVADSAITIGTCLLAYILFCTPLPQKK